MELYAKTSYELAKKLTERYSTSFSASITLFPKELRPHIYAIYGMVRIADEIVDTYRGFDAGEQLEHFHDEVLHACAVERPYSTNPIVYAFALTAKQYGIGRNLIEPFFDSMRMDLSVREFDQKTFDAYIYGSAAVVGLMCLNVFIGGNKKRYNKLAPGAERLGAAYQKVNFLRDIAADKKQLQRNYFPGITTLTDREKRRIIDDIQTDFDIAQDYIVALPPQARSAVRLSYRYYQELLNRLSAVPAETLRSVRIRVPNGRKLALYIQAKAGR